MIVTYFGAQGQVRMVYLNVACYDAKGPSLVELQRVTLWVDTEAGKAYVQSVPKGTIIATARQYDHYSTLALINLAPGEYLEWSKDAERS